MFGVQTTEILNGTLYSCDNSSKYIDSICSSCFNALASIVERNSLYISPSAFSAVAVGFFAFAILTNTSFGAAVPFTFTVTDAM